MAAPVTLLSLLVLVIASPQTFAGTAPDAQAIRGITVNVDGTRWIAANTPIELAVDGPADYAGRLAVMIDDVDFTALFERTPAGLRYQPRAVTLPAGERSLVVYTVTADQSWQEVARFRMQVLTRGGNERVDVQPTIDLSNKGQLATGRVPEAAPGPRDEYQDLTLNAALAAAVTRAGWTTALNINTLGVTNRPETLRFEQLQSDAPYADLAGYLVSTKNQSTSLSLGHVSVGAHRHLFNNFQSRGALASVRFGTRADVAMSAVNGSAIVGWNNFLGFQETRHRLLGATLGIELAPTAGRLRVEASVLEAKRLPRSDFNQGSITDAEANRGLGMRVVVTGARNRLRLEGGVARSRFGNPDDPLLAKGVDLVAVRTENRAARYLDVSYAFLNNVPTGRHQTTLSAAYRHEMVEPMFGSLMSFVRPDVFQHIAEVSGNVGPLAVQASSTWSHDNLDGIESILTTSTRHQLVNLALPLGTFAPGRGGLPIVTYAMTRTHQAGDALPLNSDFQASHVPDQMSTNHIVGLEWQEARWRAGYRFNHSLQDNRQVGRALSDLANLTNTISAAVMPGPQIDFGADLAFEGAENREVNRTDVTRRIAVNGNWRPARHTMVTAIVQTTFIGNNVDGNEQRATDLNLQLSQGVPLSKRSSGKPLAQAFVRYARQHSYAIAALGAPAAPARLWSISTGLTLSLF